MIKSLNNKKPNNDHRKIDFLIHGVFYTFYGLFKYIPSPLGNWFRYFTVKPFLKKIGNAKIAEGVTFVYPYRITIEENVSINEWSLIDGYGKVKIGKNVRIAHRVTINSSDHEYRNPNKPIYSQGLIKKETIIEDDVWIGCNSVINKGVKIGKGSIVAAGSVVNKNVKENSIVGGVPAKLIKFRSNGE